MEIEKLASLFDRATVVQLEPNDVVIVRLSRKPDMQERLEMTQHLEKVFSGVRVMILDPGVDIAIARGPKEEETFTTQSLKQQQPVHRPIAPPPKHRPCAAPVPKA